MPMNIELSLPTKEPPLTYLTLNNWKKGVITLIDQSRLPKDALKEAQNIFLREDGQPSPRPGVNWYGVEAPNGSAISGADYYESSAGATHLVMVAGTTVYRSLDNGTNWTACTGATMTAGYDVDMEQNGGYLYMCNGIDNIVRYDGSTTLAVYTSLAAPVAPTVAETGLASTGFNYYYKITAVNTVGFSVASAATTVVQTSLDRSSWDSTTNFAVLTLPAFVATQTRADIFLSTNGTDFYYLASTDSVAFKDDGSYFISPNVVAPTANTTQGPKVSELINVGGRLYGTRDTVNKYRIWFSGSGVYSGYFSSAYDGGYIDWQPGGKYMPVHVEDYRDGKGTPVATVWCKSLDGQGCVIQITLETLTIGDISITVPSAYKLPGSRGTPAAGSVVSVLNDFIYYNSQAFYNLGTRAQYLNILSTDEISSNIRPTVKQISQDGESGICSTYYDARVFMSVPYGSTTNNYTAIYDTERRAWLPEAFTIGFKKFLKYTDTSSNQKLLCWKPGDNRLSEIGDSIQGDYGVAFSTSLVTGLYPLDRNRFEFQWTREGEIEFSNPQDIVNAELLGIERSRGYTSTNTVSVAVQTVDAGWDTFAWDTTVWDDTSVVPSTFSSSTEKRYFTVQKELNAVQWRITTSTLTAYYVLRTLQTNGTATQSGKPRAWKI